MKSYFTDDELKCPETGVVKLSPGFLHKLNQLREFYGRPMKVNSACRSKAHNAKVGGAPGSFHVWDDPEWPTGGCCAVDVAVSYGPHRAELVKLALELGWSVGINKSFTHLDRRGDYTHQPQTVFLY